jgi:hypothetical protein
MTVQFSTAVRNALLDVIETTMGTSVKVQLWTGSQPANCATAASGTKLAEWSLASDWAAAASGGVKSLSSTPLSTTGLAAGSVGYYRFTDSAGTTCHEQGSVTATGGGGDLTIDNVVIAVSQSIQITGFTKTAPGA